MLDSKIDSPLLFSKLKTGKLNAVNWSPRAGGMEISVSAAQELRKMWANHLGTKNIGANFIDEEMEAFEGEERFALIRHRKREQKLRDAKLAQALNKNGSLCCEVPRCGFNFEKVYGTIGKGFAHVHHLKPLGDRKVPSETPLKELAIVCANCHAMIHCGGKCRPLDKLIR